MINQYLATEQEKREKADLDAIQEEADRQLGLYAEGEFDGAIGAEPNPKHLLEQSYYQGYCVGAFRYWVKHFDLQVRTEF